MPDQLERMLDRPLPTVNCPETMLDHQVRRSDDPKRLASIRILSQIDLDRSGNGRVARRSCRIRSSTGLVAVSSVRRGPSPPSYGGLTGSSVCRAGFVLRATA